MTDRIFWATCPKLSQNRYFYHALILSTTVNWFQKNRKESNRNLWRISFANCKFCYLIPALIFHPTRLGTRQNGNADHALLDTKQFLHCSQSPTKTWVQYLRNMDSGPNSNCYFWVWRPIGNEKVSIKATRRIVQIYRLVYFLCINYLSFNIQCIVLACIGSLKIK